MLLVPIWNASTCQCNSKEYPQHIYKSVCCWYPFEMHQLVSAIQMSTHNIYIKAYDVGTHLKCITLSVQFKWVPPTYIKRVLLVPIWNTSPLTCHCSSDEYTQHIYISVCCWYPFEIHHLVSAIQRSTHNIDIKAYVVGTNLKCISLSVQFKWVPTTYI